MVSAKVFGKGFLSFGILRLLHPLDLLDLLDPLDLLDLLHLLQKFVLKRSYSAVILK